MLFTEPLRRGDWCDLLFSLYTIAAYQTLTQHRRDHNPRGTDAAVKEREECDSKGAESRGIDGRQRQT